MISAVYTLVSHVLYVLSKFIILFSNAMLHPEACKDYSLHVTSYIATVANMQLAIMVRCS